MWKPIGKDCQIKFPDISNDVVLMLMILFEHMGIVNMTNSILRGEEIKNPDWYDMQNEKQNDKMFPAHSIDRKAFG